MEPHHPNAGEEPLNGDEAHHAGGNHGTHRRSRRPERRNWTQTPDEDDVEHQVQDRQGNTVPKRRARIARRPECTTEQEEHHHPEAEQEHDPEIRQRFGSHLGGGVHQLQQDWRKEVSNRCKDDDCQNRRRDERLVDCPVDLLGVVGAREARDQHAHAGKQRADEDHDHEEDLPRDPDGGVPRITDIVTDHGMIDDPL